jgi:hypothetical protein
MPSLWPRIEEKRKEKKKVKPSMFTPTKGPKGSRNLRLPDFKKIVT